jgi:maleylacetate reductase
MLTGIHHWPAQQRVIYGIPAAEALADEVRRAGAKRVFVTTTRSISGGALVARVVAALGERFAGKLDAIAAHSPREAVLAGAQAIGESRADLVVAVGGGSVIDATKVMLLALWRGARSVDEISVLAGRPAESSAWDAEPQALRMIAIPTTLSAAEFFPSAGVTDVQRHRKQMYLHPLMVPRSVILDPAATLETPLDLILSTGMRAKGREAHYLPSVDEMVSAAAGKLRPGDVAVIFSNGAFDGIHEKLLNALKASSSDNMG